MRILHADSDDLENPLRGGQPVRTYEINSRLAQRNAITVFTATYKGSRDQVTRSNIHYRRLGVTIPGWGLSSHLTFQARLPAWIRRTPHDIVVEEFAPPFGTCGLTRYTDKPVISLVQWFFFRDWEKRYRLPFEAIMRRRTVERAYRHFIVQTQHMGDYFRDLLPAARISKIPCGLNSDAFQESSAPGDYALFLGRLDIQHKGLDDLLEAWQLLRRRGVSIPLWLVGAGPDEAVLRATVQRLGLEDLVLFPGRMEGPDKLRALRECRFMVMPSRQETFGLVALEAMASGKPVIAYDIEHLNELLQPAWSTLVPLGSITGLADAVGEAWLDPPACLHKGQAARREARNYLWDTLAGRQFDVYLEASKNN